MRILQLRFKNLNSLAGEWIIDFTRPAYTADGIFAITGPTGAGKSTLLDAICLALYGSTPRLGKVSKGSNEIMSRHTGECHAEVTFATQAGRFRSHWSQHRAKKKADGELQNPRHEIVDAQTHKPIATTLREVAEQVERITGLDFERFTRSILLAQGSFAVFLNADPDKRAPILEQITGTGLYSQISIKVHERRTGERKKLEALQAGLQGLRILSAAEEQQHQLALEQQQSLIQNLEQQLDQHERCITWLQAIALLEQELARLAAEQQTLQDRHDAFQPEQQRLDAAQKALELAADYTRLTTLREQQRTDQQQYDHLQTSISRQEDHDRSAAQALMAAADALQVAKQQQQALWPTLTQVRTLDAQIKDWTHQVQAAAQAFETQQDRLDALKTRQCAVQDQWAAQAQAAAKIRQFLAEHPEDQPLEAHFAGIQQQFNRLRSLQQQWASTLAEQATATARQRQAQLAHADQTAAWEAHTRQLALTRHALAQKTEAFRQLLQGQSVAAGRETLADLQAQQGLLENLARSLQILREARDRQDACHTARERYQLEYTALSQQQAQQQLKHMALEADVRRLEERQILLKTIQSLTAHRQQLRDGEACPLCGSPDHPYAAGNVPQPDATAQHLQAARVALKAAAQTLADLNARQVALQKDLENNAVQQQEHTQRMATEMASIRQAFASLAPAVAEADWAGRLQALQHTHAARLAAALAHVQATAQHERELDALNTDLQRQQTALHALERDRQQAGHASDLATAAVWQLQQAAQRLEMQLQAELAAVSDALVPYGLAPLALNALESVEEQLAHRRQQWIAHNERRHPLEQSLAVLRQQHQHLEEQCHQQQADLTRQQEALQTSRQALAEALARRHTLLGEKQPDAEESRLNTALAGAESQLEARRQTAEAARRELHRLQAAQQALATTLEDRCKRLQTQETVFLALLHKMGFSHETDYLAACLPETGRQQLAQRARQLATERAELDSRCKDKQAQLASVRGKRLTEHSVAQLTQARAELKEKLIEIQKDIGGIQHKLAENAQLKQAQAVQRLNLEAQQRECTRWDDLHSLIGSADGKKYRNFAQGLTFEVMISHANQQLKKMSDRYLLIRSQQQPLELNVVDGYQAGEVRSTRNLSGGESFIVSLALALGLSQMASQNVRVDSLFLDEGFGTLDEDALDTALDTLSGLQQDGRLIGVISHVPAMKERISTQIQVSPQTGGRSILKGPGCSRA